MSTTTNENEQADQHRAESRSEARIVVPGTLPLGEAIAQEMIVAFSAGSSQDVGHYTEARKSITGSFGCSLDLCLRRALRDMDSWLLALRLGLVLACGSIGDELLLDLVGVKKTGPLAVGLVDFVLGRGGSDAYEIVEGNVESLRGFDFVSQTEDFLICDLSLVKWQSYQGEGPLGSNK